jgi:predicted GNAT family N-acyltransferase
MSDLTLSIAAPRDCSANDLAAFAEHVKTEGEVEGAGLAELIQCAERLVFLRAGETLIGTAGVKNPRASHRSYIARNAGVDLDASKFPLEIGWIVVGNAIRGQHHSRTLTQAALEVVGDRGVFATTRSNNGAMLHVLPGYKFEDVGGYQSERGDYQIRVFVRPKALNLL